MRDVFYFRDIFEQPPAPDAVYAEIDQTLIHEVQHAIQDIEGFAPGGNPGMFETRSAVLRRQVAEFRRKADASAKFRHYEELDREFSDIFATGTDADVDAWNAEHQTEYDALHADPEVRDIIDARTAIAKEYGYNLNVLLVLKNPNDAKAWRGIALDDEVSQFSQYRRLAGEVEARNATTRSGMTEAEKRESMLADTADVAPEDMIYLEEAMGGESMESDGRLAIDLTAAPELTIVPHVDLDLKDTKAVKAFLKSHFQGMEFTIRSDGRLGIFVRNGLEATLKRKEAHRTALPGLKEIVENSYPVGYEDVDEKHEEARQDLRGQFVYGALLEIADKNGVSQKYIATIKLDDTKADDHAHFKDIAIKKIEDALSTEDPERALPVLSKQESSISGITIQQLIDVVKRDFANFPNFHPFDGKSDLATLSTKRSQKKHPPEGTEGTEGKSDTDEHGPSDAPDGAMEGKRTRTDTDGAARFRIAEEQTDTPEFKRWFGDSKVVDEDGKPMVVYHGTRGKFSVFDSSMAGSNLDFGTMGKGFYFTTDRENAENIARNNTSQDGEPTVMECFLNIRNPKEVAWNEISGDNREEAEKLTEKWKSKGYDGFVAEAPNGATWWVVFEPNQIKSATDNVGTFDPGNPDIRFRLAEWSEDDKRDIMKMLRPFVRKNRMALDGQKAAEYLKTQGVDIAPEDAMTFARLELSEIAGDAAKKQWRDAYTYYRSVSPIFDFAMNFAGENFMIRPSDGFLGEDFSGSWISPAWVKYSRKRPQGAKESRASYRRYLEKREAALKNAPGMTSDELARAYARETGIDHLPCAWK